MASSERDRDRFSLIGHAALPLMCPLREDELLFLLGHAALSPGERTVDVGGGRGDLSRLLASRFGVRASSVDRSAQAGQEARRRAGELPVEVVVGDGATHLATLPPGSLGLASALGATHCFGSAAPAWERAVTELASRARHVLVGDLAARTSEAARAFDVALLDNVTGERLARLAGRPGVLASLVLSSTRVATYERTWCASVAAHVAAHPGDPRNEWARARLAWTDEPSLRAAREELVFAVYLL